MALLKHFGRHSGDWDQIVKRGYHRVLTVYSKSGFFYDKGRQRGTVAEYMEEFENVTNKKLKTGAKKFKVLYLPMPPGQLQEALNDGFGDIACAGIIITLEREKLFDFTVPPKERRQTGSCHLQDCSFHCQLAVELLGFLLMRRASPVGDVGHTLLTCHFERANCELDLASTALLRRLPYLGECLGRL